MLSLSGTDTDGVGVLEGEGVAEREAGGVGISD